MILAIHKQTTRNHCMIVWSIPGLCQIAQKKVTQMWSMQYVEYVELITYITNQETFDDLPASALYTVYCLSALYALLSAMISHDAHELSRQSWFIRIAWICSLESGNCPPTHKAHLARTPWVDNKQPLSAIRAAPWHLKACQLHVMNNGHWHL
jgi:hypothetical protein